MLYIKYFSNQILLITALNNTHWYEDAILILSGLVNKNDKKTEVKCLKSFPVKWKSSLKFTIKLYSNKGIPSNYFKTF